MPSGEAQLGDFFNVSVGPEHETGDIWINLPCLGLLGTDPIAGIVISPACDLSNHKIETITYLPIVSVRRYFRLPAFSHHIVAKLNEYAHRIEIPKLISSECFVPDGTAAMQALLADVETRIASGNLQDDAVAPRVSAGLRLLLRSIASDDEAVQAVKIVFGSGYDRLKQDLVRNSSRSEIHFIPADRYPPEFSAVPEHSVALFRYPITAPIAIFEAAQNVQDPDWDAVCDNLATSFPIAAAYKSVRPEKRASVRNEFMADVITRYLSVYIRLGSPDFPDRLLTSFASEIL